jgi:hypothetical protein
MANTSTDRVAIGAKSDFATKVREKMRINPWLVTSFTLLAHVASAQTWQAKVEITTFPMTSGNREAVIGEMESLGVDTSSKDVESAVESRLKGFVANADFVYGYTNNGGLRWVAFVPNFSTSSVATMLLERNELGTLEYLKDARSVAIKPGDRLHGYVPAGDQFLLQVKTSLAEHFKNVYDSLKNTGRMQRGGEYLSHCKQGICNYIDGDKPFLRASYRYDIASDQLLITRYSPQGSERSLEKWRVEKSSTQLADLIEEIPSKLVAVRDERLASGLTQTYEWDGRIRPVSELNLRVAEKGDRTEGIVKPLIGLLLLIGAATLWLVGRKRNSTKKLSPNF